MERAEKGVAWQAVEEVRRGGGARRSGLRVNVHAIGDDRG